MTLEATARANDNPLFFVALVIWLGINTTFGIRFLQTQTRYFQLLQQRQGLKMPTVSDLQGEAPVQTTSFVLHNWRYIPYLFRIQPDRDCEQMRRLVLRRFVQIGIVLVISTALFSIAGILAFA